MSGVGWPFRFGLGAFAMVLAAEGAARLLIGLSPPVLRWHDFSSQLKVEQMEELAAVEVVIAGTSMAQQGLVPAVISPHLDDAPVYNAGLNGGVPVVMAPWLEDQVVPLVRPRTVIWGLSPLDLSARYGDATERSFVEAPATKDGWLSEADRAASAHSALVASRAVLRDPSKLLGDEADTRAARLDDAAANLGEDGERIDYRSGLTPAREAEMRGRLQPFRIDRDDLAAVARSVTELQAGGVSVVFVELPVPDRFVALLPRGVEDLELSSAAIDALAEELGIQVLKPTVSFEDKQFVDFTHLDADAARAFSEDIGKQLAGL